MNDGCGRNFVEFCRYSDRGRGGSWVKTSRGFSQRLMQWDAEEDSSEAFSETWPRSAIVSNTTAFRLRPLAQNTNATASGSSANWPTPAASPPGWKNIDVVDKDGKPPTHPNQRFYDQKTGRLVQRGLEQMVKMFPTPTAGNSKHGGMMYEWGGSGSRSMISHLPEIERRGHLNVAWVCMLMGYPADWVNVGDGNAESHE